MDFDEDEGVLLHDSISMGDLLKNGSQFTVNSKFDAIGDTGDLFPELENDIEEDEDTVYEHILSPWEKEFSELQATMTKIPDYNIYKKMTKEGYGGDNAPPMPKIARVAFHYNAYFEKESIAFDSTYMRGQPKVSIIGQADLLIGVELAVRTMTPGEEAQFLISHELLYGEIGCPPRIKPKASGLFIIHLIKVDEIGDEEGVEQVDQRDRRKFSVMFPKITEVYKKGKDTFAQGLTSNSCRLFHKAVNTLESCQLSNEDEQKEQTELLLKLYLNLAVCYNKMNMPAKACSMCNELARISNISKNCKALYQEGKALRLLGEYKQAEAKLLRAQRLEPTNAAISKELKILNDKSKLHRDNERAIWKKAFGNTTEDKVADTVDSAFEKTIETCMIKFRDNVDMMKMPLPEGLTPNELVFVRKLIKDLSLNIQSVKIGDKTHYTVLKK